MLRILNNMGDFKNSKQCFEDVHQTASGRFAKFKRNRQNALTGSTWFDTIRELNTLSDRNKSINSSQAPTSRYVALCIGLLLLLLLLLLNYPGAKAACTLYINFGFSVYRNVMYLVTHKWKGITLHIHICIKYVLKRKIIHNFGKIHKFKIWKILV